MAGTNSNTAVAVTPPTLESLTAERDQLQARLDLLMANPMSHLLDITPLDVTFNFEEILKSYGGDEINAFGAMLGSLELPLKARNIEIGINQARDKDGKGRESSAGISKKGSVEFFSISDLLHLPPALLAQLGARNLLKIVGGKADWVGKDEIVSQAGTATAMSFTR
jgi:hypothetical protein